MTLIAYLASFCYINFALSSFKHVSSETFKETSIIWQLKNFILNGQSKEFIPSINVVFWEYIVTKSSYQTYTALVHLPLYLKTLHS